MRASQLTRTSEAHGMEWNELVGCWNDIYQRLLAIQMDQEACFMEIEHFICAPLGRQAKSNLSQRRIVCNK